MKKTSKLLAASVTILLLVSFTVRNTDAFIGTYGVAASDPAQIKLSIHADHTFYFQDFSVADKRIVVTGTWTREGKKVVLKNHGSKTKFHNVWTFDESGQVAKSRKGLTYYRLGKTDS